MSENIFIKEKNLCFSCTPLIRKIRKSRKGGKGRKSRKGRKGRTNHIRLPQVSNKLLKLVYSMNIEYIVVLIKNIVAWNINFM